MNERYAFTINEFCQWSRLGRTKTYEFIAEGKLPIFKVGTKTLIRVADAKALLDSSRPDPHRGPRQLDAAVLQVAARRARSAVARPRRPGSLPRPSAGRSAAISPKKIGGPFKGDVRTVATASGIVTIAPHFAAQGLIGAAIEAGMASIAFDDQYSAAAIAAFKVITGDLPPMAAVELVIAATKTSLETGS
jgi:excisionase family DNA binding protein